jgi:A/G-specific adenine glycosylase
VGAARQSRSKGGKTPSRRRQAAPPIPVLPGHRRKFRERLLKWYAQHGRDLPWRKTAVPYEILVSEIMLQQTQVDRVLPKYREWLTKYPTMEDLAEAPLSDVKKTWYPLGYNIRPVRLHSIARESVVRYGGTLPRDPERLLAFKGIGRYTAGAIRAFAFREDAPILDTNVMRVLHRVFVGKGDAKRQKTALWGLSEAMIPRGKGYDFNQALMDFGAMVCIARDPYCLLCPMNGFCKAYPFQRDR